MKMNKSFSFIRRLFSSKFFLIILSFLISIVIWISINLGDYAETSYVVGNIPITINLPAEAKQQGLEVFNGDGLKGSVTVKGNRSLIGSLTSDDIQIVPEQTDSLTSAGSYTLSLVAKKTGRSTSYTIESVSPSTVYIKLDRNRKITKEVEERINYKIPQGYYGTVLLNQDEISISGPETEIKQIDKVVIEGTVAEEITSSVKNKYTVKLLDSFGEELTNTDSFKISPSTITATISVLQMKEVEVKASAEGGPVGVDLSKYYKVSPDTVYIAGESELVKEITQIKTEPLNFSTLKNRKYNIIKNLEIPSKCIDINSVKSVNVILDLSSMKKKNFTITNFDVTGLEDSYAGRVTTSSIDISVYGSEYNLDLLTGDKISAEVNIEKSDISEGAKEMPVTIKLLNTRGCWIYGNYKVVVDISKR